MLNPPNGTIALATGGQAVFGSPAHVADLRATVRQMEELRGNCPAKSPARQRYSANLRTVRSQLRAAEGVAYGPVGPWEPREVAWRNDSGEWTRRTYTGRAAYLRRVARLEDDAREYFTREA